MSIDDALNSNSPVFEVTQITAHWQELPPVYFQEVDDLRDFGHQIGPQGYSIEHTLDDGLPGPVSMTGQNDAIGILRSDLVGRQANIADRWGWRTDTAGGSGAGVSVVTDLPSDTSAGDYSLVAIAVDSTTAVTDEDEDPLNRHGWEFLGSQEDGSLKVWVWGRRFYPGAPPLALSLADSANWSWIAVSVWASTVAGSVVPVAPGVVVSGAETVSQTAHSLPEQTLRKRGYTVGVWATTAASDQWSATGGDTEVHEVSSVTDLMVSRSSFRTQPAPYAMTASTSASTSVGAFIGVPLEVMDRKDMHAGQYFSQFNVDSPIHDFERDTAAVTAQVNVLTESGVEGTPVFTGQMADIKVSGQQANLLAVSKTRIDMEKSRTLPVVHAAREGCTTDWLACWLMAQGGQYAGIAPSPYTRVWVPFYGSFRPFMDGKLGYGRGYEYNSALTPVGPNDWRSPIEVPGPFVSAMHAQQLDDLTQEIYLQFDDFPATEVPGQASETYDFMSTRNNVGRMTCWIYGGAFDASPASLTGIDPEFDVMFRWEMSAQVPVPGANHIGGLKVEIRSNRQPTIYMGSSFDGYTVQNLLGFPLPEDDEWHFFGVVWDWSAGHVYARIDDALWTVPGFGTTDDVLKHSQEQLYADGGYIYSFLRCHTPISDFQVEIGPTLHTEQFSRFYPDPFPPSRSALYRRTAQYLEAIAEPVPVNTWNTLAEVARATLSSYRLNEEDNYEFLPPGYFGEEDQMVPEVVADTTLNAGELDIVRDPTKTRNVVTVEFQDTRVDTNLGTVMDLRSAISLPPGVSFVTFPLDVPVVEIQGALLPYGTGGYWNITNLSSAQIASPSTIPADVHFISLNTKPDGTGSVVQPSGTVGRIVDWDASTVTVRFTNNEAQVLWISNSGADVPFMRLVGWAVRTNTSYATVRDNGSVQARRERPLTTQLPWIHRRQEADLIAGQLVTTLSRPQDEVSISVMGDPRRRPGRLVEVHDSQGTGAAGMWRILGILHDGNGPMYVQRLQLKRQLPIMLWDDPQGWDESVWGE